MRLLTAEELQGVVWSAACFVAGVAWAAYRAVGWVERIRSWASTVSDQKEVSSS